MIVSVKTNIKSPDGQTRTTTLGRKTILIGPNESGKSAIVEAAQLALTGGAYGLFLRSKPVKTGQQLFDLAPEDAESVFAEVEFEDGTTARWEMEEGKRPKQVGPRSICLAVSELRVALSGNAATARKFFLDKLVGNMTRDKLEDALGDSPFDLLIPLEEVFPDLGHPTEPADILTAQAGAGKAKRQAKAKAAAAKEILSSLQGAEQTSQEEIYGLWEELAESITFAWLRKQFRNAEELRPALRKVMPRLGDVATMMEGPGSARLGEKLEDKIRAKTLYDAASHARGIVKESEQRSKEFEALEKALDSAVKTLLEEPLKEYTKRVSRLLPKGDTFQLRHTDKEFVFGLKRGGCFHTALSGSTEARVLATMASTLKGASDRWSNLVVMDDRMWDPTTLSKVLAGLEDAPGQIIVMSTIKPRGRRREGWHYVEVERNASEDENIDSSSTSPGTRGGDGHASTSTV